MEAGTEPQLSARPSRAGARPAPSRLERRAAAGADGLASSGSCSAFRLTRQAGSNAGVQRCSTTGDKSQCSGAAVTRTAAQIACPSSPCAAVTRTAAEAACSSCATVTPTAAQIARPMCATITRTAEQLRKWRAHHAQRLPRPLRRLRAQCAQRLAAQLFCDCADSLHCAEKNKIPKNNPPHAMP